MSATIISRSGNVSDDVKNSWEIIQNLLEKQIPQSTFDPWVKPMEAEKFENNTLIIKTGQSFAIQMLQRKYFDIITNCVHEVLGENSSYTIVFDPSLNAKAKKKSKVEIQKEVEKRFENHKQMQSACNLDLKYTFENFVKGENSLFAYEVAKIVAENPGQKYNPLFIYGSVGLGKTHLMQAIGHYLIYHRPELKIKFVKTEEFTNQLIESLKKEGDIAFKMKKFRERYRNTDILLFDDIQFIEGKKRTFEEVFHTFETLHQAGKQIVFTSDKPPKFFENIEERLKSRFEWGISVEIKPPDFETRVEILKNCAKLNNFELSDELYELLAQNFDSNVRELEGAYNQISTWASIFGEKPCISKAKEILKIDESKKKITPQEIIKVCADYFKIEEEEIIGTARAAHIAFARQCAIYVAKELTGLSLNELAKAFNKKHTTVMYSVEKVKTDKKALNSVKELKGMF